MPEHTNSPTRDQVVEKLRALVAGEITPEAASDWARPWITKLEEVTDGKVKRSLVQLAGADLIVDMKGHLLHGPEDFVAWLKEFTGKSY